MSISSLQTLLENLLERTLSLEKLVLSDDSEPDDWVGILEARQEIIGNLTDLFADGVTLSDYQKQHYLGKVYEIDQRLLPIMEKKKEEVQTSLSNIQRSKAARNQYFDSGYTPYGAFFDRKK